MTTPTTMMVVDANGKKVEVPLAAPRIQELLGMMQQGIMPVRAVPGDTYSRWVEVGATPIELAPMRPFRRSLSVVNFDTERLWIAPHNQPGTAMEGSNIPILGVAADADADPYTPGGSYQVTNSQSLYYAVRESGSGLVLVTEVY